MATIILPDQQKLEGFDDTIAADDQMLRDSLAQYVPEIRNAKLNRATKDGLMTVTVVKQAGSKGAMTDKEYFDTQTLLMVIGVLVSKLDLKEFTNRIHLLESAGPMLDPTLWRKANSRLTAIKDLAYTALKMKDAYAKAVEVAEQTK